jgi:uncharacterized membrane protein required for colicin V production
MSFILIDLLMVLIFVQIFFVWNKNDFISEVFRFFGVLCATFVSLHYYVGFGEFLHHNLLVENYLQEFIAYAVLAGLVLLVFALLREGWLIILNVKLPSTIDRWASSVLSIVRLYFLCGLVFLGLIVLGNADLTQAARYSISGLFLKRTAVGLYQAIYSGIAVKIFPGEMLNEKVVNLIRDIKESEPTTVAK